MTLIRNRTLASRTSGDIIRKIHAFALTCDCEYVWILYSHYEVVELFQSLICASSCGHSESTLDAIDWCSKSNKHILHDIFTIRMVSSILQHQISSLNISGGLPKTEVPGPEGLGRAGGLMSHQAIEHIQRRLSHGISVKFDRIIYLTGDTPAMVFGQKENTVRPRYLVHSVFFWKEHIPTLIWVYIEDMSEYSGEFSGDYGIFPEIRLESWNTRFESLLAAREHRPAISMLRTYS